ncbi:MAG: hypothetical protein M1308_04900 [Actinobacteria bacterium]|nr:hypothetical protein [Actinomycetota bacterium]
MKQFYKKSIAFWLVLLVLAFINAIIRETTYKPPLTPYIGIWTHQISSVIGILLFYIAIYRFLKFTQGLYNKGDVINVGLIWISMTFIFEGFMNIFVRKLTIVEVMQTYYFWKGETWIFVLLSLLISPIIIYNKLDQSKK